MRKHGTAPMSELLGVEELATAVGCTPGRLRTLMRSGLLTPWDEHIHYELARVSIDLQLVVASERAQSPQVALFHPDIMSDPRFFILATNSIDPVRWGAGWTGTRHPQGLPGVLPSDAVKLVPSGKKVPTTMKRIAGAKYHIDKLLERASNSFIV